MQSPNPAGQCYSQKIHANTHEKEVLNIDDDKPHDQAPRFTGRTHFPILTLHH